MDFYSGIVLSAIGIPVSMFTPIFALARTVGWISHWTEMISDPGMKIGRPRQLYTVRCAATTRKWPIANNSGPCAWSHQANRWLSPPQGRLAR